ncbi:MAG: hypothetical protein Q4C12_06630 [Clostridia bacterium]|nr:hypothetical protein [Clostridia bacterium]
MLCFTTGSGWRKRDSTNFWDSWDCGGWLFHSITYRKTPPISEPICISEFYGKYNGAPIYYDKENGGFLTNLKNHCYNIWFDISKDTAFLYVYENPEVLRKIQAACGMDLSTEIKEAEQLKTNRENRLLQFEKEKEKKITEERRKQEETKVNRVKVRKNTLIVWTCLSVIMGYGIPLIPIIALLYCCKIKKTAAEINFKSKAISVCFVINIICIVLCLICFGIYFFKNN